MDDIKIMLPCGFSTLYKNLKDKPDEIECFVCENHKIKIDECLKMSLNQLNLTLKKIELENDKYKSMKQNYESIIRNREFCESQNIEKVKRDLKLRREELKHEICEKIELHYNDLFDFLEEENNSIKSQLKGDLEDIEIKLGTISDEMNFKVKIDLLKKNLGVLKRKVNLMTDPVEIVKDLVFKKKSMSDLDITRGCFITQLTTDPIATDPVHRSPNSPYDQKIIQQSTPLKNQLELHAKALFKFTNLGTILKLASVRGTKSKSIKHKCSTQFQQHSFIIKTIKMCKNCQINGHDTLCKDQVSPCLHFKKSKFSQSKSQNSLLNISKNNNLELSTSVTTVSYGGIIVGLNSNNNSVKTISKNRLRSIDINRLRSFEANIFT
ncbi:unnamed protein product [Brachionus calyciflorus]|uniref:Uncharacterized protein n=1 Tax=Brachionus calyciflorus TaxID=104777 RepID=A0A814GSQ9_9BILA|nr:unnamed protein product [Brachionus calyciflorus]